MKYEIIARATTDWAYLVAAENPDEATNILQQAIKNGEDSEFDCRVDDSGMLEIISQPMLLV
jgi:hypothetical protein